MCGRCVVDVWYMCCVTCGTFVLVVVQVDSFDCLHAPINSINVLKDTISLLLNCTHTEIHFILFCVLIFHCHPGRGVFVESKGVTVGGILVPRTNFS